MIVQTMKMFSRSKYLKAYMYRGNYHSILGIRPRGCDDTLQTVVEGIPKIVGKSIDISIYAIFFLFIFHLYQVIMFEQFSKNC